MKNLFKKYISVLLAAMLILTAAPLSIISFAWDPNVDDGFNLSLKTKIFHQVDGEWVEADTLEPGESVKARVYIGTDYYAGPGQVVVFYNNSFFEDEYASNVTMTLAVNTDPESSTEKYGIGGSFNKGKGAVYALLNGGYITEEFAQTHTALTFFYLFEGKSPTCQILNDEHWFAEFDLKVREDATGTGSFVILEETVTDPYEHQNAYISITKGQQGSHPDNASNMYLWSANVTVENTPVSVPVTNSYYAVFESENEEFDSIEVLFNSEIPFPAGIPEKEGFNFMGWSADGVTVLETLGTMDTEGKKFYAVWEAKEPEHVHIPQVITVPATCTENGCEYTVCSACGEPLSETTVLPSSGHTPANEWETVTEPTLTQKGEKIKKCTVCGETAEKADISMLRVAGSGGVQIEYSPDDYSGEVGVVADKPSDKNTENLINNEIGAGNSTVYDLAITVDGAEAQPQGTVTVKLPLPEGYDASSSYVYEINTESGAAEKIDAEYKDGYFIFEATTLGSYVIFEEYDGVLKIRKPSITTIKYGDAIILHADLSEPLPEGAYIKWTADNGNFSYTASKDGSTCQITPGKTGNTTFTATVYDSSGNEIQSDTQTMTSKAGFFQKIGAFFRKLFKLTKVYPELFRYMA